MTEKKKQCPFECVCLSIICTTWGGAEKTADFKLNWIKYIIKINRNVCLTYLLQLQEVRIYIEPKIGRYIFINKEHTTREEPIMRIRIHNDISNTVERGYSGLIGTRTHPDYYQKF